METNKALRRSRVGRVVADKSAKTIRVIVEGIQQHPKYKKYIKTHQTFMVHDPKEACHLGDLVRIEECRPVSKNKKWVVLEVIEKASSGKAEAGKKGAEDDSSGIDA